MNAPYEILIRGENGVLKGAHVIDTPGGLPRGLTMGDLATLAPDINGALLARIAELEAELAGKPESTGGVTKLTIMRRLGDKWPILKAVLSALPELVQDSWTLAQEINATDPLFLAYKSELQEALGLSEDEFDALLKP